MRRFELTVTERELRVILTAFDYCGSVKTRYRSPRDVEPSDVRRWRGRRDVADLYARLVHIGLPVDASSREVKA